MGQKGQTQILILAGIIILLAITGGIFYLGRITTPKPQPQNMVISSPQLSPTPDETANWKTYTNSTYGYSFKYPQNFLSSELKDVLPVIHNTYFNDNKNVEDGVYKIRTILVNDTLKNTLANLNDYREAKSRFDEIETLTVDGKQATSGIVTDYFHTEQGWKEYVALVPLSSNYTLEITGDPQYKNLIDKILSTFKFLP